MERKDDQFDRAKFDAVWRRVMHAPAESGPAQKLRSHCAEPDDADELRDFMDDEARDAQFYGTLACRCSGMARQMLRRISSDEKCHLKKLRARYFILTGKAYTPPGACPLVCAAADALRQKYSGEKDGSEAYREAAEHTADTELRDTYLALSRDEARHAKMIGCIIESLF